MKQIILIAGFILMLMNPTMAQNGVERKMIEIKKILTLSPSQEEALKTAYDLNQQKKRFRPFSGFRPHGSYCSEISSRRTVA
jgi:hypothetical protein